MWVKVGRGTPPFTVQSSFEGWKLGSSAFLYSSERATFDNQKWQPLMSYFRDSLNRI